MLIGIDLDNTIINYNKVYKKFLDVFDVKINLNHSLKDQVKFFLERNYGNSAWTKFQSLLYGPLSLEAELYSGFTDFINLNTSKCDFVIVSHRTSKASGFSDINLQTYGARSYEYLIKSCVGDIDIFFENDENSKINKIISLKCDVFIDDLTKILIAISKENSNIKLFQFGEKPSVNHLEHSYPLGNWNLISNYIKDLHFKDSGVLADGQ